MLFDHGVETILVPAFGGELMSRGEEYVREMMEGMTRLAQHPTFADFYRDYNVRVRFYGDWRRQVNGLPGAARVGAALWTIAPPPDIPARAVSCTACGPTTCWSASWTIWRAANRAGRVHARGDRDPLLWRVRQADRHLHRFWPPHGV